MAYSWVACEARTGIVITDLPDLNVDKIGVTIGDYTSTQAALPVPTAPDGWQRATEGGGAYLIALDADTDQPVWGGLILKRKRDQSNIVTLSPVVTLESYFDRRYVGDSPYTNVGQNAIVADLIQKYIVSGSNGGLPCTVVNLDGAPGTLRTRTEYTDDSDKTILSVLTELMGVDGGPEWTIGWQSAYVSGVRRITPVVYIGSRVGTDPLPGLSPNAVFDMVQVPAYGGGIAYAGGNLQSFSYEEDWSSAGGANDVLATSTANADSRPESTHVVTVDPDRPTYEYRFTPSTSITDVNTLQAHAVSESAEISNGVNTLAMTAVVEDAPKLNTDWFIGDAIGFDIQTPSFPDGLTGSARCTGWELAFGDVDTITPTLTL